MSRPSTRRFCLRASRTKVFSVSEISGSFGIVAVVV